MAPHLTLNQRVTVIDMRFRNVSFSKIAESLNISITTARSVMKNYEQDRRIGRKKGFWPKRVAVYEVRHAIDEALKTNPFLKSKELQEIIYHRTGKKLRSLPHVNFRKFKLTCEITENLP